MCSIELYLPDSASLKHKRSILKGIMARLHKEFNVSCAELDYHDVWQSALLGVAVIANDGAHVERMLENVVVWLEKNRPDVTVVDHSIELIR